MGTNLRNCLPGIWIVSCDTCTLPSGRLWARVPDGVLLHSSSVLVCLPRFLQRQRSPGVPHPSRAVQAASWRRRAAGYRDRLQGLREGRNARTCISVSSLSRLGVMTLLRTEVRARSRRPHRNTLRIRGPLPASWAVRLRTGSQSHVLLEDTVGRP